MFCTDFQVQMHVASTVVAVVTSAYIPLTEHNV